MRNYNYEFNDPTLGIQNIYSNPGSWPFSTAGNFPVTLTIVDDQSPSCSDEITKYALVHELPTISFTAPEVCEGEITTLTAISNYLEEIAELEKLNISKDAIRNSDYSEGLTTPIAAITLFAYLFFNYQVDGDYGDPRTALMLVGSVSVLMISPIPFAKFPLLTFRSGIKNSILLVIVIFSLTSQLYHIQKLILIKIR